LIVYPHLIISNSRSETPSLFIYKVFDLLFGVLVGVVQLLVVHVDLFDVIVAVTTNTLSDKPD
jgi:hypothetical protein